MKGLSKMVAIGASVFVASSLVTSGAAAFIISISDQRNQEGEVRVAVINDVNVRFEDLAFDGSDKLSARFCFDADIEDHYGRFFYIEDNHNTYEHLTVRLTGRVLPVRYVKDVTLYLKSSTEYNADINPILDAIKHEYLIPTGLEPNNVSESALAAYDFTDHAVKIPLSEVDDTDDSKSFDITFGFRWGRKFAYMNPAYYFDDDAAGGGPAYYSDKEVVDEMAKFVRLMHYGEEYLDLSKPLPDGYEENDSSALNFDVELKTVMRT